VSLPERVGRLEVEVVGGGTPTDEEHEALTIAVRRVIAARDARRSAPAPLWGLVGRLEARDGLSIRSRVAMPRSVTWTPVEDPERSS